jgi:hypothetical protein
MIPLNELLNDHHEVGTQDATQIETFVLGGMTEWGQYKQALRELYKRVRGVRSTQTDFDKALLDLEDLKEDIKDAEVDNPTSREERHHQRLLLDLRKKLSDIDELSRLLKCVKIEVATFYRAAAKLKESLGEITPERRLELDREHWKHKHMMKVAALRLGQIPDVTLKNTLSLPLEERKEWLSLLHPQNTAKLVQMLETDETTGRPAVVPPTEAEVHELETEIQDEILKLPELTDLVP